MDSIKDNLANEYRKDAITTEHFHREELQRELQLQEIELSVEFEQKAILNKNLLQEEIKCLKATHTQEMTRLQA